MSTRLEINRRDVLSSGIAAGGALVLGCFLPLGARLARAAQQGAEAEPLAPNAFVRVGADDTVTVMINHSEMGQGVSTALSMLVADELDADWNKVRVEFAPVNPVYNHTVFGIQMVGGSSSTWSEYDRLRNAGATARAMLVSAAAKEWGVDSAGCTTQNGFVIHEPTSKRASYGSLVGKAAKTPAPEKVQLKDPKDYKLIGRPTRRIDSPEKVNGTAKFGIDVAVPGMLVCLVARSPVFGGKVAKFDDSRAKAVPGVKHVVQIDRGIAVVADGFWAAKKGREALTIEWNRGDFAEHNAARQREEYNARVARPGAVAHSVGDAAGALDKAAKKIEATYELPFLAHAPMETLNCVADVRADRCEVWTGTQFQTAERMTAATIAGLKPEQVKVNTMLLGGGFGRRAVADCHFVAEAVQVSKAVGAPVKVIWTREDDIRGGYYRPAATHAIVGALDDGGKPLAWRHRIACQSFIFGSPFEAVMVKNGVDTIAVEGAAELPYDVPNLTVEWCRVETPVPTLWWRSVGHSHSAFAVECFIDELAHAAKVDPLEFRRGLLSKDARRKRVVELVAEKSGWGKPAPAGRGRGIAVHESFGSFVAQVAEVSVEKDGTPRVHRVVCAVDCGPVVNPQTIAAQMEGAVAFALSAVLHGEISFDHGEVRQRNFHDYPVVRMNEMPEVETHIVPSTDKMGGIGEPGVPPLAPAVANAIFALTGKRLRRLPIRAADLRNA